MKYLSFVVPSYNAEKYLDKCIPSLVFGKDDVEIIIVNDGSTDNTLAKARYYESLYPEIVKVIDKENGGHGSTINAALKVATGIYFKCVDADDWVDDKSFEKVLNTIKSHYENNTLPDMYVTDFLYENLSENLTHLDTHKKRFKKDTIIDFEQLKKFAPSEFLMMHNVIFKLDVLKKSKVNLPEHTFYVDNLFIYDAMFDVKTMFYIDVPFYHYYVGRKDQSVTFENMTKNWQMQLRVMEEMSLRYTYDELKSLGHKHYKFMVHELMIISYLTLFYIACGLNKERKDAYYAYLKRFKEKNNKLYRKIRYRTEFIFPFLLIDPLRKRCIMRGYKIMMKKTHWN